MTHTPIVHNSIAGARAFYRLRRQGYGREEAYALARLTPGHNHTKETT